MIAVRQALGEERTRSLAWLIDYWGPVVVGRGETWRLDDCDLFVAGDFEGLAAVDRRRPPTAELVAINALEKHHGAGSAIVEHLAGVLRGEGFTRLQLMTTNDNIDALRFYQRRGFRLSAIRPGAIDAARALKPTIPTVGDYGLPIRDEIDLVLEL